MTGELHYMSAQAQSMVLTYVVFEHKLPHSLMFSTECQLYHSFISQENHSNSNAIVTRRSNTGTFLHGVWRRFS